MIDSFEINKTFFNDETQDFLFINNQSQHNQQIFFNFLKSYKKDGTTTTTTTPLITVKIYMYIYIFF